MSRLPDLSSDRSRDDRGQVVLLAAVVVAMALVAMTLAYAQLGYDPGDSRADPEVSLADRQRAVERAVATVEGDLGRPPWTVRDTTLDRLNESLRTEFDRLERSPTASTRAVRIEGNGSLAVRVAADRCPSGPMRTFGDCEAYGGVVVQERAGETTLVAVAVDLSVRGPGDRRRLTFVAEPQRPVGERR